MLEHLRHRVAVARWGHVLSVVAAVSLLAACGGESRGQAIFDAITAPDGYTIIGETSVLSGEDAVILQPVDADTALPRDLSTLHLLPAEYRLGAAEVRAGCDNEWWGSGPSVERVCVDWFERGSFRGRYATAVRPLKGNEPCRLIARVGNAATIGVLIDGVDDSRWVLAVSGDVPEEWVTACSGAEVSVAQCSLTRAGTTALSGTAARTTRSSTRPSERSLTASTTVGGCWRSRWYAAESLMRAPVQGRR